MPFLPPNQQRQSTEGNSQLIIAAKLVDSLRISPLVTRVVLDKRLLNRCSSGGGGGGVGGSSSSSRPLATCAYDTEYLQCARYLMDSFMRHVVLCCGRLACHILVMSAIVMRAAGACDSGI